MDWVTADPHFGHKNIIGYENRPFGNVLEMDERIIEEWNSRVDLLRDRVFVLGDFSFYGKVETSKILERLNGWKILLMGNHDRARSRKWWLDAGFDEVLEYPVIYQGFYILSHEPVYLNTHMPYANIHGHLHSNRMEYGGYLNAGVELHGYAPILVDAAKEMVRERLGEDPLEQGDGHVEECC